MSIECAGCSRFQFSLDGDHTRLDIDSHIVPSKSPLLFVRPADVEKGSSDCSATAAAGHHKQRCCRQKMRVDLTEIDTFSFVVRPTSFDAHVCNGRCPPRFKPTNDHSLLQSLLHLKTKHKPRGKDAF